MYMYGWSCRNSLHSLSDGTIASLTYSSKYAVIFWLSSSVNFFFLGVADPEAGVRIGGLGRKPEASVGSGLLRGVSAAASEWALGGGGGGSVGGSSSIRARIDWKARRLSCCVGAW